SLKIYDPASQEGTNPCHGPDRGGCPHLCLPVSPTTRVCKCATGYAQDPTNETNCIGVSEFLMYSINWEIRGLPIPSPDSPPPVLGPISRVSMATSVDFEYCLAVDWVAHNLYWTDLKMKVIETCRTNGSFRYVVIPTGLDSPYSVAVDPPKGLLFWSDTGKQPSISRSALDGTSRAVVTDTVAGGVNDIALDYEVR
ncbi:hypothetical protein AAG570_007275, partial [Ranatra chinensis]